MPDFMKVWGPGELQHGAEAAGRKAGATAGAGAGSARGTRV